MSATKARPNSPIKEIMALRSDSPLSLSKKLQLALLPTLTVLLVLALVERYSHQQLLFASLASSAFLIYLDPKHTTNSVRTLVLAQGCASVVGFASQQLLGTGYGSAAAAMILTIIVMIVCDAVHPPAVSTALSFAFRSGPESNLILFALAISFIIVLVALQRGLVWLIRRNES